MKVHALVLTLLFAAGLHAEPAALLGEEEKQALREEIRLTKARASAMTEEADRVLKEAEAACYKKFLVSDCLDKAKEVHRGSVKEAREVDLKGKAMERELKKREMASHQAKMEEEAPRKEAEAAEQAAKNRQAREAAEKRVAEKAGR